MSDGLPREGSFGIVSLNVSAKTGVRKTPVPAFTLVPGEGVSGDAHSGLVENRQVSLLAMEEIEGATEAMRRGCAKGLPDQGLKPGDFAENITTRGAELHLLPVGTKLEIGGCLLEISKIGKECHAACEIRRLVGDCVMPRKGIFARVLRGGEIRIEDRCHYSF